MRNDIEKDVLDHLELRLEMYVKTAEKLMITKRRLEIFLAISILINLSFVIAISSCW